MEQKKVCIGEGRKYKKKNGKMDVEESSEDEDFVAEDSESGSDAGESDIDNDEI